MASSIRIMENPQPFIPQTKPTATPLRDALERLEITPFDPERVDAYKLRAFDKAWTNYVSDLHAKGWTQRHHLNDYIMYRDEVLRALGKTWTMNDRYLFMRHAYDAFPYCFCMGWHRHSVDGLDIPEFVRRKMAQISSEIPGVGFAADVLETDKRPYDPFLIVKLEGEEYYIEVWGSEDHEFS